ncbi:hypothetical protein VR010_02365 [Actinomycetaceae bacterium L2_0104]
MKPSTEGHTGVEFSAKKMNVGTKKIRIGALFSIVLSLGIFSIIATPVAQAVSYTYANWVLTAESQIRYSGTVSSISGGYGETELFSADGANGRVYIETYYDYPGYRTVMFASGNDRVDMNHVASSNAKQQCYWNWPWAPGSIGSMDLYCRTK